MEKRVYPALSETVYWEKLSNGLTVAVVPRPGFSRKLAYFVTDYGAVHTDFAASTTCGTSTCSTALRYASRSMALPFSVAVP